MLRLPRKPEQFRADERLIDLTPLPIPAFNPPSVDAWNLRKDYLLEMAESGATIPQDAAHPAQHAGDRRRTQLK